MHIAEGYLPWKHALGWTGIALPFWIHGIRKVSRAMKEAPRRRLELGAAGGFAFLLSALKIPSLAGSSSHPTGIALGAVRSGPSEMAVVGTIVLVFQALVLAHGGITTLGANAFAMAVVGGWTAWGSFASEADAAGGKGWCCFWRPPFPISPPTLPRPSNSRSPSGEIEGDFSPPFRNSWGSSP